MSPRRGRSEGRAWVRPGRICLRTRVPVARLLNVRRGRADGRRAVTGEFSEGALQAAGGVAWSHPALSGRVRNTAIITALAAQGVSADRSETHVRLGRQRGLDDEALSALRTLLSATSGCPRASLRMETIHGSIAMIARGDAADR
jgi:hypothetical protein